MYTVIVISIYIIINVYIYKNKHTYKFYNRGNSMFRSHICNLTALLPTENLYRLQKKKISSLVSWRSSFFEGDKDDQSGEAP